MKTRVMAICVVVALLVCSVPVRADWQPGDSHKMHYPQLPDPSGWDVCATFREDPLWTVPHAMVLADDWQCSQTGQVGGIHFWGSWKGDNIGEIIQFDISIYEDIPADPAGGIPYSRPGSELWHMISYEYNGGGSHVFDVLEMAPSDQGWYDPYTGEYEANNHQRWFQYNLVDIPNPFIQTEGEIYWLAIEAWVNPFPIMELEWGWKSSLDHWNDDAVWGERERGQQWGDPIDGWTEMYEPPDFDQSLDLAFVIQIPEPATIIMILGGSLSGLAGIIKKRK